MGVPKCVTGEVAQRMTVTLQITHRITAVAQEKIKDAHGVSFVVLLVELSDTLDLMTVTLSHP